MVDSAGQLSRGHVGSSLFIPFPLHPDLLPLSHLLMFLHWLFCHKELPLSVGVSERWLSMGWLPGYLGITVLSMSKNDHCNEKANTIIGVWPQSSARGAL